jgi:hypothetical protein
MTITIKRFASWALRVVQSWLVRHTELQPPTRSLENGDFAANAIAAVIIIAASNNMHIERFIFSPCLFFAVFQYFFWHSMLAAERRQVLQDAASTPHAALC